MHLSKCQGQDGDTFIGFATYLCQHTTSNFILLKVPMHDPINLLIFL